jgi:hypothetical protein
MSSAQQSIVIHLAARAQVDWSPSRHGEPITVGIPLGAGALRTVEDLELSGPDGSLTPVQGRVLDRWPDGTVRWVLIDFKAHTREGRADTHVLRAATGKASTGRSPLTVSAVDGSVHVATGAANFAFILGGPFPFSDVVADGSRPIDMDQSGLVVGLDGQELRCRITSVAVRPSGPLRVEIDVRGRLVGDAPEADALDISARIEFFADSAVSRIALCLHNRRRAQHPSGQWPLGDAGSVLLDHATLRFAATGPVNRIRCAPERGSSLVDVEAPFEIYQESSGGAQWKSDVHCNSAGRVNLRFRGYRMRSGERETHGERASPIVKVDLPKALVTLTIPKFWENFPKAISVKGSTIEVGLFPRQAADRHELQGGEQKTHCVVVAFGPDAISDPPLAWCHDPSLLYPSPDWCTATNAVPFLVPAVEERDSSYRTLFGLALDVSTGFVAKRERIDEYGWRNFGDLFADHESAFQPADAPFVSHYNNQYDAIGCFAKAFLQTGDWRWWGLMDDLARHVRDIDIYRTDEDKAAYNNGLFWHTTHYLAAGTSTHRTYPRGSGAGGGPGAEHNYAEGLMLHYFLTGEEASRDTAVGLGQWVIRMDDGRLTVFRWLAGGATGLASASGSTSYHGPGRGAANSIRACLVAYRLTSDSAYADKVDELIRRCIHPADDLNERNLLDVERRWFYTVFLQALGTYLQDKLERGQIDPMFAYARTSLLHYARWMTEHERPYLERPGVLEFPNETWAAQDMRKADVLFLAALHAPPDGRDRFLARARFFWRYSVETLYGTPRRSFTRLIILILASGGQHAWFENRALSFPAPVEIAAAFGGAPRRFEGQRARAVRHGLWLAGAATLSMLTLAGWFLIR